MCREQNKIQVGIFPTLSSSMNPTKLTKKPNFVPVFTMGRACPIEGTVWPKENNGKCNYRAQMSALDKQKL